MVSFRFTDILARLHAFARASYARMLGPVCTIFSLRELQSFRNDISGSVGDMFTLVGFWSRPRALGSFFWTFVTD